MIVPICDVRKLILCGARLWLRRDICVESKERTPQLAIVVVSSGQYPDHSGF